MFILHSGLDVALRRVREDAVGHASSVLILAAATVDALCACRILVALLKAEFIPFKLVPVLGYNDLAYINETLIRSNPDLRSVFMLDCGAVTDLGAFFSLSDGETASQTRFYVTDSHRPYDLRNLYSNSQVFILDDGEIEHKMHNVKAAYLALDAASKDPDGLGSDSDYEDGHELDILAAGPVRSRRPPSPPPGAGPLGLDDDSYLDSLDESTDSEDEADAGSGLGGASSPGSSTEADEDDSEVELGSDQDRAGTRRDRLQRRKRLRTLGLPSEQQALRRAELARHQKLVARYYSASWYGASCSRTLYTMAVQLGRDSNKLLWWAIVGMTDQYINNRLTLAHYRAQVDFFKNETVRHNTDFQSAQPIRANPQKLAAARRLLRSRQRERLLKERRALRRARSLATGGDSADELDDELDRLDELDELEALEALEEEEQQQQQQQGGPTGPAGSRTPTDYGLDLLPDLELEALIDSLVRAGRQQQAAAAAAAAAAGRSADHLPEDGQDPSGDDPAAGSVLDGTYTGSAVDTSLKINHQQDLNLMLYRHWSLFDALMHAPHVATQLGVWNDKGAHRVRTLLVRLGIPLSQACQPHLAMDVEMRRDLPRRLADVSAGVNLPGIMYPAFIARQGFRTAVAAADVVYAISSLVEAGAIASNIAFTLSRHGLAGGPGQSSGGDSFSAFSTMSEAVAEYARTSDISRDQVWLQCWYRAYDALESPYTTILESGLNLAMAYQRAIIRQITLLIEQNAITTTRFLRFAIVKDAGSTGPVAHQVPMGPGRAGAAPLDSRWSTGNSDLLVVHPLTLTRLALYMRDALRSSGKTNLPLLVASLCHSTDSYFVIGLDRERSSSSQVQRNVFSVILKNVAAERGIRLRHDGFDASVLEIRREDLTPFLEAIQLTMKRRALAAAAEQLPPSAKRPSGRRAL
ncbi:hypothetical protein H696_01309 [Fonticula alba]|uniref:CDC45-like protein n=1 Tax=Fonticula alba TaxID=691883 RepID=A0A058ZBU9_FONAL|nr:hypothetical protein H696_01309 [Fonticula alba]KCV71900.1 hypothetical protein H696_01309 [Fonticula alba]|eukprot:XP_009493478.1 hypothetical protein H696_01309 [Fonticula alba]